MGNITQNIAASSQEACPQNYSECRLCAGQGVPILPLREVTRAKPLRVTQWDYSPEQWTQSYPTPISEALYQATDRFQKYRVMRQGYFYLLFSTDQGQTVAQIKAYEVTPEGYFRLLPDPRNNIPAGSPAPIPAQCVGQGHDTAASFIYITAQERLTYKTVYFAFANDPWVPSVIERYMSNYSLRANRMQSVAIGALDGSGSGHEYVLRLINDYPGERGTGRQGVLGVWDTEKFLLNEVLEYGPDISVNFLSAHPMHSRAGKAQALKAFAAAAITREKLPADKGIPVLRTLDPIGEVQETNFHRHVFTEDWMKWKTQPQRIYRQVTAQAIETLRTSVIAQQCKEEGISGPAPAYEQLPDNVRSSVRREFARLQEFYDESARSNFVRNLQLRDDALFNYAKTLARRYADKVKTPRFAAVAQSDYADDSTSNVHDRASASSFCVMVASCLEGGPSDIEYAANARSASPSPTTDLWRNLLENINSLFYQAVFRRNATFKAQFQQALQQYQQQETEFNRQLSEIDALTGNQRTTRLAQLRASQRESDIGTLYGAVSQILTSDEATNWRNNRLLPAVNKLMNAASSAALSLGTRLSAGTTSQVSRLLQQASFLYGNTVFWKTFIDGKVGDMRYLTQEMLSELERARPAPTGTGNRTGSRTAQTGAQTSARAPLPHIDPTVANLKLQGTVWDVAAWPTLNELPSYQRLIAFINQQPTAATGPGLGKSLLRGSATFNNGLNVVALYFLSQSLQNAMTSMDNSVGNAHTDAMLAYHSALTGVVGTSATIAGETIKGSATLLVTRFGWAGAAATVGAGLAKAGAVIGVVTSLIEAYISCTRLSNVLKTNQSGAQWAYGGSIVMYVVSAIFGVIFIAGGGWTVLIAMALFSLAGYLLRWIGDKLSRTAMQSWLDRCVFGFAKDRPAQMIEGIPYQWNHYDDMATAMGAFMAAWMSLAPQFEVLRDGSNPNRIRINCTAEMPGFDTRKSAYAFAIMLERTGANAQGERQRRSLELHRWSAVAGQSVVLPAMPPPNGLLSTNVTAPVRWPEAPVPAGSRVDQKTITGTWSVEMAPRDLRVATLYLRYWPDHNDTSFMAEVIIHEVVR